MDGSSLPCLPGAGNYVLAVRCGLSVARPADRQCSGDLVYRPSLSSPKYRRGQAQLRSKGQNQLLEEPLASRETTV